MDPKLRDRCLQHVFSAKALPLLTESLDALARLLQSQGAPPARYLGATTGAMWLKTAVSLQHLIDGGRLEARQIDAALAEIAGQGVTPDVVLDRFLLPYLLLAAARPTLAGDPPSWLLDALAAMIAVDADDALLDVAAADDRLDGQTGCLTLPWLARRTLPARWLSRQLTPPVLWRVVSGALDWQSAIAADLLEQAHAIQSGVAAQVESATREEDDVFALMDAFHGLTSVRKRQRNLPVTLPIVPAGEGLRWNLASGVLQTIGKPVSLTESAAAGSLEPPIHALAVPLPLGAELRAAGWRVLDLELDDADAADELLDSLLDLALDPLPPQTVNGLGFRIVPREIP